MIFNVGDVVKIICADEETSSPSTRRKIRQVGKIVNLTHHPHLPYVVYFETDNVKLNFMAKEIELYIKIGQQLLFNFME